MNEKQKKILLIGGAIFAVLLIILLIFFLISRNNPSNNNGNGGNNTTNVTIEYWGLWEPDEVMHPLIEKYESEHPGVKISYAQQTFNNYEARVYTRLEQSSTSTEPAPDIIRINNTWLPKYMKYLSPLPSSIMTTQEYSSNFYPTALSDFTGTDGKIYAIPWEIDGLAVIYNKQLLADAGYTTPPTDWDSFVEAAVKLTKTSSSGKISQAGLAVGTSSNVTHSADILTFMMLQNSAELIDSTRTEVNLTSDRAVAALNKYTEFAKSEDPVWASYLPQDMTMFYRGDLAMMFAPSWRAFDIITAAPQVEFGIAPLPQLPNNDPVYYSMYWGDTVSSTCEHPEVAWDFIKFLSEPEQQRRLFANASQIRAFGEPYSRVSMNEELAENPYTQAFAQMAPYMKSWQIGDQNFVESLLREAITQVVENNKIPESVLSTIEADINDQLAQSNK